MIFPCHFNYEIDRLLQWATWSHYNSIPYRRLFHKWAYCITKTMRESSLSASQAKKVSKNLLVYFLFTNNLQVPSVLPEKELRLMFFKFVFCCVLVEFINIVAFTSIMDLQQMDTMTKAKLISTISTHCNRPFGCKGYRHVFRQYRFFGSTITWTSTRNDLWLRISMEPNFLVRPWPESLSNFLVAWTQLYDPLCPCVCLSVRSSVGS